MKKVLFLIFGLLFFTSLALAAPSSTMSISPVAVDGTTITASDENTRNSAISTTYNAHTHTDISQVANTLNVGDAAAGNKTITAYNADSNKPYIRYDDTNDRWEVSQDGSNIQSIVTISGATNTAYILPQTPTLGSIIYGVGNSYQSLSAGTAGKVLTMSGGIPSWQSGGKLAQIVNTHTGTMATGTTTIPFDNTIPQNTEGVQYMTLAITPTNASSTLKITVTLIGSSVVAHPLTVALFQDSTANAIATAFVSLLGNHLETVTFTHYMTAGTTSSTTFKVRAGMDTGADTFTFNGYGGGSYMGGTLESSITIEEYTP